MVFRSPRFHIRGRTYPGNNQGETGIKQEHKANYLHIVAGRRGGVLADGKGGGGAGKVAVGRGRSSVVQRKGNTNRLHTR